MLDIPQILVLALLGMGLILYGAIEMLTVKCVFCATRTSKSAIKQGDAHCSVCGRDLREDRRVSGDSGFPS